MMYSHRYYLHQYLITDKKRFLDFNLISLEHSYKEYKFEQAIPNTWSKAKTSPRDIIGSIFSHRVNT